MSSKVKKVIAVVGATGQQGGGVVRSLQAQGKFNVRALTRDPAAHRGLAAGVVQADLDRPDTLRAAFEGVHGVFLVTNFWQPGVDEAKQAQAAVRAARYSGVRHFIWSTLPDVESISHGKIDVPHFTGKARIDRIVRDAGFEYYTFVIAPYYYQNLKGVMAPQKQANGSLAWTLPIDPTARVIHMGDINELGNIVAGAFAHPELAGHGEYLPLVGDLMCFNEIVKTLNRQGHSYSFIRIPAEGFPKEMAEMFRYFEAHTYLGAPSLERIALAVKVAGAQPTKFARWANENMPAFGPDSAAA